MRLDRWAGEQIPSCRHLCYTGQDMACNRTWRFFFGSEAISVAEENGKRFMRKLPYPDFLSSRQIILREFISRIGGKCSVS